MRALTRAIPNSFAQALSENPPDPPIDVALARAQHGAYCEALAACGVEVTMLPPDDAFPDCCFVEDTAVIVGRRALITRPGAPSRRGETAAIEHVLAAAGLEIFTMQEPATLDGGDCLLVGKWLFVGLSARTNRFGIAVAATVFEEIVVPIVLPEHQLHLKCLCSPLGENRMLAADRYLDATPFLERGIDIIGVPGRERYASNAVAIGNHVIVAEGHSYTHGALESAGFTVHPVPVSEVRKADGALTCQSLLFG